MLLNLLRHRELILRLVKRDLKVRYKSSALGFFWSIAKPLLLVAVYTLVFDKILGLERHENIPYSLVVMAGLLPWMYMAGSVSESMFSILANANLIKKVKIPHEVFPVAVVMGNLMHFCLALAALAAYMAWNGIWLSWQALWIVPIVLLQTVFILSLALIFSALNVFYRDVASAFEVGFTAWMYATPIVYPIYLLAGKLQPDGDLPRWLLYLYMLNPMAPLVLAYRRVLLYASPIGNAAAPPAPEYAALSPTNPDSWLWLQIGVCVLMVFAIYWIAVGVFRHYSRYFADEV